MESRKVSKLLWLGIIALPFIFAWFTLRRGYPLWVRGAAFGWFGLLLVMGALAPPPSPAEQAASAKLEDDRVAAKSAAEAERSAVEAEREAEQRDRARIIEARSIVQQQLKDPDSAKFGGIWATETAVCGMVNARNSFGGYTGEGPFVVIGGAAYLDESVTEALVTEHCVTPE